MKGLHALIAIELFDASTTQHTTFCNMLEKDNWSRISNTSMVWRLSFREYVKRTGAIRTIQSSLHKAKQAGNIEQLEYAVQMDLTEVLIAKA